MNEFELIRRYFTRAFADRADVIVGVGDDGAILALPGDTHLVVSTDTLVEGTHFPLEMPAHALGYRALAVNLSDLAAMGAKPMWAMLALTIALPDPAWLEAFAEGFYVLADAHEVALVGGDTTRGGLSTTVTVHGVIPSTGPHLLRSTAREGDGIYVTGTLGDAATGLRQFRSGEAAAGHCVSRFLYPTPRVEAGQLLRECASAAIDISDGLIADLGHIAEQSGTGAEILVDALPLSEAQVAANGAERERNYALTGGDDYELCFTLPEARRAGMESRLAGAGCPVTRIGTIISGGGVRCLDGSGRDWPVPGSGYRHFA